MQRILVWDVPTRLFHWLLVAGVLSAFAIAQFGDKHSTLFPYHAMIGIGVGMIVLLRVLWGIVGTRYARFASFLFGPAAVIRYFRGIITGPSKRYPGHNPGSSYAIFLMLALVVVIVGTGLLMATGNEAFEEVHSLAVYILLGVAALHVAGVIVHSIRHRENITASMVSGRKRVEDATLGIRSTAPVWGLSFLLVVLLVAGGLYRSHDPPTRRATIPLIGTGLQLGEAEGGGAEPTQVHHHEHEE